MTIDYSKYPFDIRIRHHVSPNLYFPFNQQNVKRVENYPPLIDNINWSDYFANAKRPNVLDIGCGMGKFLLDYSLENNDDNILGLELRKTPVNWIESVIKGESLANVSVLWYSVANRIDFIESNSIDKIFYFFPDPWFKEKHKKRRAFKLDFILDCYRVLKPGGVFYLQTDIEDVNYFQINLLKEFNSNEEKFDLFEPSDWDLPITDKESHCIRKGFKYWRFCAKKL